MTDQRVALTASEMLDGLRTVQSVLAPDLTPEELRLFAMVANRSGLDPFAKQIYAVKRKGRVTFQTGIDGYRSIAARTGLYDGQDEPEYGPVCPCEDNRPAGHPEYATVRVYRKGVGRAIAATAFWHEYKPEAGQSGQGDVMWTRMPRVMIAKVAEALALRKAFPYDPENRMGIGADIYTADEISQAERTERPAPQPRQSLADVAASKVKSLKPVIDSRDAQGVDGPSDIEKAAEAAGMPTQDYITDMEGLGDVARQIEAETTPAFTEAEAPLADPEYHEHVAGDKHSHPFSGPHSHGGVSALVTDKPCGWALQPKKGERIYCTLGEMHAGEHSWTQQAIDGGGRVVPPSEMGK